jgi:hypothetical protein
MILISHRGNIEGPDSNENHPSYILNALDKNYAVEIDVWLKDGLFYLGHDTPDYKINDDFLKHNNLWCHAKNIDALYALLKLNTNCFYHNNDDAVLTSLGFIWTYPGKQITNMSIAVLPEKTENWDISSAIGICSDFIKNF